MALCLLISLSSVKAAITLQREPLTDPELYRETAMIWNMLGIAADPQVIALM